MLDFCFLSKGMPYQLHTHLEDFESQNGIKLNYSSENVSANLQITPSSLLHQNRLTTCPKVEFKNNQWLIDDYQDSLSLIFFFLSRMEEYFITETDTHGRIEGKQSVFYQFNRLEIPNTDVLVKTLWQQLGLDYSVVLAKNKTILTFDIDSAYAYKHKGLVRSIGSDVKSILKKENLIKKWQVRFGHHTDPFDTFSQIIELNQKGTEIICFFLLADHGKFDKNIKWNHPEMKKVIQSLKPYVKLGIHPSYQSHNSEQILKKEIYRLDDLSGEKTSISRQHFLKFKLPNTYQNLLKNGIKQDYSMGYADELGFRAGTAFAFPFFDLTLNQSTDLKVYPITFMDSTLKKYLKLSPSQAIEKVKTLKQQIQNTGGLFIPLWHNETISFSTQWKDYQEVFKLNLDLL